MVCGTLYIFQIIISELVADGFSKPKGIRDEMLCYLKLDFLQKVLLNVKQVDVNHTFASVSSKGSFIVIMALVAHVNLELHQMDVRIAFLTAFF